MKGRLLKAAGAMLALSFVFPAIGCHQPDDGLSSERKEQADRLDEIAQKSGGDWNKVSQADRDYILKITSGNENSAKMLLMTKTGFKGSPPTPGRPPAAPGTQ